MDILGYYSQNIPKYIINIQLNPIDTPLNPTELIATGWLRPAAQSPRTPSAGRSRVTSTISGGGQKSGNGGHMAMGTSIKNGGF